MQPKIKNEFETWLLSELYKAYFKARRGKRNTNDEYIFESNLAENMVKLRDSIISREYIPSGGIAFVTRDPVTREIFAAPFRDRVIHHFIYNMVYDWWDKRFIYDSYSCRIGKGTLFGIDRLSKMIRCKTENYTKKAYVVKLDIKSYFMSLPRAGLYRRAMWGLDRQFPEKGELYEILKFLWRQVIFDDPVKEVEKRGSDKDWLDLPFDKSLFRQPPGQGIVIGNLSSQLLSNIYLDLLDRFIKYNLGYKYYGRYVDDFFLIVSEEEYPQMKRDIHAIEEFLRGIELRLHPKKRYIQEVPKGVAFLGAVVYPRRVVPGRRLKRNFYKAVKRANMTGVDFDVITSYRGLLKQFCGDQLETKVLSLARGWEI